MIQIDLEMPKCCDDCKFVYDSCKCIITGSRMDWEKNETERLPDCPLREIAKPTVLPIAEIHFDEDKMREICKEVAENIVVEYDFKGMTNGEIIKTLFPNANIEYRKISVYVTISPLTNLVIFDKDWWNSPYNPQESEVSE